MEESSGHNGKEPKDGNVWHTNKVEKCRRK